VGGPRESALNSGVGREIARTAKNYPGNTFFGTLIHDMCFGDDDLRTYGLFLVCGNPRQQWKVFRETTPARRGKPTGGRKGAATTNRGPGIIPTILVGAIVAGRRGKMPIRSRLPVPCMDVRSSAGGRDKITES
jgi:hypothetical protein